MSSNADVIKEFLVKMGFVTDEAALKKFGDGISKATKTVEQLATVVSAAAIAVSVGVAKFANNLEALYFASQRTGVAAANLKAFDRAAQSFGTSAGEAAESVEGLARFMRNNPSGGSYLNSFLGQVGESAYDANGHLKDNVDLLSSLGKLMRHNTDVGQGYQNPQLSGIFGIDEKTMLAIQNPEFLAKLQKIQKEMKNSGLEHAAAGAHKFKESLRGLEDQLYIFGIQVVDVLQGKLGWSLDSVTDWFRTNGKWLANQVTDLVGSWIDDFNKFLHWTEINWPRIKAHIIEAMFNINWAWEMYVKPALSWMWEKFEALDEKTGGWASTVAVLTVVLGKFGALSIAAGVLQLAAAFTSLGAALVGLRAGSAAAAATSVSLGGLMGALVPGALIGGGLGYLFDELFPNNWLAKLGNAIGADLDDYRHPANDIMERLTNQGFSRSQAIGILANLRQESSYKDNASSHDDAGKEYYGLAQWSPDRQKDFKAWAGYDIHDSNRQKQIEFIAYELRHDTAYKDVWALMQAHSSDTAANANFNARTFSRNYERPANGDKEAEQRGMSAMNYQMTTTINVNGDKDPHKTADLVARHIDRLNQQTARLFAPTLR